MKNRFVSFRSPEDFVQRLSAVATAEDLSVSDIARRATIASVRELEEKHNLAAVMPHTQTRKSAWISANR
jgi:hypothetical protein